MEWIDVEKKMDKLDLTWELVATLVAAAKARGREQGREEMRDEILVKLRDRAAFIDWGLREPRGGAFRNPNELAADFLESERIMTAPKGTP